MKIRKEKKEGKKEAVIKPKSILPGAIFVALVAAVIIFAVMLNVEKNALSDYEKGVVFFTARTIPEGQLLTEENIAEYIQSREIDISLIPEAALTSPEELYGLLPITGIDSGALLTTGMFEPLNKITESMEKPVIAGFAADDLYQVVGGILRAGDRIHIYTVDQDTGLTELVWEDVFVQQVFDGSGVSIQNADQATAAQRVNILLEQDSVQSFYTELASGSLRVVKVW